MSLARWLISMPLVVAMACSGDEADAGFSEDERQQLLDRCLELGEEREFCERSVRIITRTLEQVDCGMEEALHLVEVRVNGEFVVVDGVLGPDPVAVASEQLPCVQERLNPSGEEDPVH